MTPTASIQSTGALPKGRACTPAQYRRTAAAQTPRHALAIAHAAGLGTHRELRPGGVFGPRGIGAVLLAVATAVACVWSTPAEAETSAGSQEPQVLVGNLDVGDGGSGGIQRTLGAARSGFGQAFTTGPTTGGYALGSLGIQVSQFSDGSTAGDDLRVTVNGVADGGGPGAALCTLTHPSSFQAPGVSTFGAPAGEDACPQLAKETTYFAVIEWIEPDEAGRLAVIPQTFPTDESAASDEDPGGAQGWSIADVSWYLTVASGARTWTAYETTASFKIRLQEAAVAAIVANRPAAGLPTISGTAQVGETLTASVAGIGDADGLDNAVFSHQWIRTGGTGTATDIEGATGSTYAPVAADAGATIAVRVTFEDDGGTRETLLSAATETVAAAPEEVESTALGVLSVADAEASEEEDATLDFAVTLDPAADAAVTVDYATSDGTATSGADYTGTSGTLTFLAGETAKTVSVPIIDDAVDDGGETLTLTLANAAGAEIGAAAATGIIRDDDGNRLSVADAEASEEEDATLDFAVTLDPAADAAVTVDYATSDGTATSGADYTGTSGTLTFLAGETAKTVSVPIIDDAVDDGGETLTLTLSQAAGANIGAAAATGIIRDDDGNRLTVADAEASEEEDATLDFAVTLDPAADAAVTVDYATSDGTATSGADYTGTSGTLTFLAGETAKTVSVPIIDDAVDDGGETLTLTLSQAAGANIGTAAATGIIRDDDGNRLTASFENVPDEHDGGNAFVFRVAFSEEVGISYATLRDESFSTTDGDVTAARRVDGRHDLWEITVEPDSRAAVSITLPGNRACGTTGAVCTRGDDPRPLGNSPSATVAGPPTTPLTASFGDMPATHAGEEFEFRLTFSEEPEVSYVTLRDHAFDETGGTVRKAKRRTQGSNLSWDITVKPNGVAAVTIELPATTDCAATGAICTHDERPLSNASSATVAGASTASAVVDGPTLTLSWPTPPDGFAPPGGSDFAVRVDGRLLAVASASFRTRGVALHLSESARPGQDVVVDYLGSAMHPLRDAAGAARPPWRDLAATNVTGLAELRVAAGATEAMADAGRPAADGAASASLAGRAFGDAGLSALAGRTGLRRLDLSDNALVDISALSGLRALESLDLSGNAVSDLAPLTGLTELRRLDLSGNRIDELWPIGGLPKLEVLLLAGNRVADIGALTHLGRLENLGLAGNLVADVGPLADLWSLRRLDLGGNPAPDLSPVGDLETLVWLRLPSAGGEAPTHRLVRLRWLLAPNAASVCLGCGDAAPGHAEAR